MSRFRYCPIIMVLGSLVTCLVMCHSCTTSDVLGTVRCTDTCSVRCTPRISQHPDVLFKYQRHLAPNPFSTFLVLPLGFRASRSWLAPPPTSQSPCRVVPTLHAHRHGLCNPPTTVSDIYRHPLDTSPRTPSATWSGLVHRAPSGWGRLPGRKARM